MTDRFNYRGNVRIIKSAERKSTDRKSNKKSKGNQRRNSKRKEYSIIGNGDTIYKLTRDKQGYSKEEIERETNKQSMNQIHKRQGAKRSKSGIKLRQGDEENTGNANKEENRGRNEEILEATASDSEINIIKKRRGEKRRSEINKLTMVEIKTTGEGEGDAGRFKQKDIGIEIDIYSQSNISISSISSPYISSKNEININGAVINNELRENLVFKNYVVRAKKLDTSLYRVFNDLELKTGGRFYGAQYQNLSKNERGRILIYDKATGECWPTYEYDFKSLHIRLIYDYKDIKIEGSDYYLLDGIPNELRNLIKIITNILINSDRELKAREAIKKALREDGDLNELFETYRDRRISRVKYITKIIDAIKKRHKPVEEYFHSGAGLKLQRIDSDIAENIFLTLMEMNIPCLVVHDSFIVPIQYKNILKQVAENAYQEVLSFYKSKNFLS